MTSLYHFPPEHASRFRHLLLESAITQGDPLHLAYVDTCWLRPRDLAYAKTRCLVSPSRKYTGNSPILSQTIGAPRGRAVGGNGARTDEATRNSAQNMRSCHLMW